jgi:hypothetical protein
MSATSIRCPECDAKLNLPDNVPAGARPRCPRCGVHVPLNGSTAVAAGAARPAAVAIAAVPKNLSAAPPATTAPSTSAPRGVNWLALGIIAAGACLVLAGLVGAVVVLCLVAAPVRQEVALDDDEPAPSPVPKKKPALKVKPAPKPLIELTPDEEKKVDAASRKAVDFLRSKQIKDGNDAGCWQFFGFPVGNTSLVALTLLECKVPANDPAIQQAAAFVRARAGGDGYNDHEIYQVALAVLFLNRLDDPRDKSLIQSLALRIVAHQGASGAWGYSCRSLSKEQEGILLRMLKEPAAYQGKPGAIDPKLNGYALGVFQPQPSATASSDELRRHYAPGDNSCTQFALLALWNARRHDLPLDAPLQLVARHFRHTQNADGSWFYVEGRMVSGLPTMTCAGLLGVAVGYGVQKDVKASDLAKDEVIQKALKRLAQNIGNPGQSQPPRTEMYYLWSVERVGVLYQLAKIDGKDWYRWGLEILLHHQQANGAWVMNQGPGSSELVDTSFALLFLQRANLVQDLTDKLEELATLMGGPPGGKQ